MGFHPDVVVFDVNETLSDMAPLADRFTDVGAPSALMQTWFASLLRDGFALTTVGVNAGFAAVGEGVLRGLFTSVEGLDRGVDAAVRHVMTGFGELALHPDVVDGLQMLAEANMRMVTLTNGSTTLAEAMFATAGVSDLFERFMSVEDAGAWKPARQAYAYAAEQCGTPLAAMLLVAAHPWDVDGAKRAGMHAAWLDRRGAPYPDHFTEPDIVGRSLDEISTAAVGSPS
ncbi:MAG: haloacid dehalogenase type II [Actinomycetes bacterium]